MTEQNLRHFFVAQTGESIGFTSKLRGGEKPVIPERIREQHGTKIKQRLEKAWQQATMIDEQRKAVALSTRDGFYLEFESSPGYDLATKGLEQTKSGIRLANIRTDDAEDKYIATVFIPLCKRDVFLRKVQAYLGEETEKGRPKNQPLIESINDIKLAVMAESFWQGRKEWIPGDTPVWCEIWLSQDSDEAEDQFRKLAINELGIDLLPESLKFPERRVILGKANREQLQGLIVASPHIAEFRRAPETADFFVELENEEQTKWAQDLCGRLQFDRESKVYVCILDTGVNNGHILLKDILNDEDCRSYDPEWETYDHEGHGTRMSGLAAYGDLQVALESAATIDVPHRLESIKILPPRGENDPQLYGAIVVQSVSNAIIDHPERQRILCMAVTSQKYSTDDGHPSSWSAAIDELTSGYLDDQRKLIFLSAGNVCEMDDWKDYPTSNTTRTIQDPGQSWNAITVGAYTKKSMIDTAKYAGAKPVAPVGGLSPFSSTSYLWESRKWPIKPDIILEGGNVLQDDLSCCECSELSLLTLNYKPTKRQFSTINATSAATAQAAWMAAQIQAAYPEAWPETIRALLIHSADWTDEMKQQFMHGTNKMNYYELLRICGYGVPDLNKALWCMRNSVNLVIQSEIQPYDRKVDGGYCTKDMHIHELPWPKDVLIGLGETPVTLRVTLSYFIEPGPGEIGWGSRYRYPSCLLRFDTNGTATREGFLARINRASMNEENEVSGDGGSVNWTLGKQNRHLGSIHSDSWHTTAAELATSNLVGIYPAIGWWRERPWLGRWNRKARYSLVVSVETQKQDVDLYTPIEALIKVPVKVII